jgi:hypothetical protein
MGSQIVTSVSIKDTYAAPTLSDTSAVLCDRVSVSTCHACRPTVGFFLLKIVLTEGLCACVLLLCPAAPCGTRMASFGPLQQQQAPQSNSRLRPPSPRGTPQGEGMLTTLATATDSTLTSLATGALGQAMPMTPHPPLHTLKRKAALKEDFLRWVVMGSQVGAGQPGSSWVTTAAAAAPDGSSSSGRQQRTAAAGTAAAISHTACCTCWPFLTGT